MKRMSEKLHNFPDDIKPVATAVEGQALEDEEEFDKRWEDVDKEIHKDIKLPFDGAPKQPKPKEVVIPKQKLSEYMLRNNSSLVENINEEDAARVVNELISHKFGIKTEVVTYKDDKHSNCVIVEFVASKEDCEKMPYDDMKEELYKRFGNNINISCKQFSSPNLKHKGTEYKLKLFVLKEKKDKSKIYAENLNEAEVDIANKYYIYIKIPDQLTKLIGINPKQSESVNKQLIIDYFDDNYDLTTTSEQIDYTTSKTTESVWGVFLYGTKEDLQDFMDANYIRAEILKAHSREEWDAMDQDAEKDPITLFDLLWNELTSDYTGENTLRRIPAIKNDLKGNKADMPLWSNDDRYRAEDSYTATTNRGADPELRSTLNGIKITPQGDHDFTFAKFVADTYSDYGITLTIGEDVRKRPCGIIQIPDEFLDENAADLRKYEKLHAKGKADNPREFIKQESTFED